jgi:hypothetical protein
MDGILEREALDSPRDDVAQMRSAETNVEFDIIKQKAVSRLSILLIWVAAQA